MNRCSAGFAMMLTVLAAHACTSENEKKSDDDDSSSDGGGGPAGTGGSGQGVGGGATVGSGGATGATCSAPTVTSICTPEAVIRVAAHLGTGMDDVTGALVVNLAHFRLGGGASGGVPHTGANGASGTVTASAPTEVQFDLCAGGEMWSEDNCEFNLWGFVDQNGSTTLDAGEPAGRALVDISCTNDGAHCFELVLDCVDGPSCVAFTDPAACTCQTPSCDSDITTCT